MAGQTIKELRDFPSIEELAQSSELASSMAHLPRPVAVATIQQAIAELKERFKSNQAPITIEQLYRVIQKSLDQESRRNAVRVINATGILVHTNLGRAPLPEQFVTAILPSICGFANVEYDLETGQRGNRGGACERNLAKLADAEAGTVVNNCAAALFIMINTFATRKKVVISRGELVQIGGGFRIPDILRRAGAKLAEVGTTNITTAEDYQSAIDEDTALILKVHKSNFVQAGFTQEVALAELVSIGKSRNVPVINDLGSGVFVETRALLGYSEPTVQESVKAGADLTCFSADKLLGSGQGGLIVGKSDLVRQVKRNPLFRAVRADKVTFALLEQVLASYLDNKYATELPLWRMLSVPESELYKAGKKIAADAGSPAGLSVEASKAYIGGGALPESNIASVAVVFSPDHKADRMLRLFRGMETPVIGRIENDRFMIDLKAVAPEDYPYLTDAIRRILHDKK